MKSDLPAVGLPGVQSVARPPGRELGLGTTEMATQGAPALQAVLEMPLGSAIFERPNPPISATYRSGPNMTKEFTPLPSLVEPTLATAGPVLLSAMASIPSMRMMSPDLM